MSEKRAQGLGNLIFFLIGIPVVIGLILGVNMAYNAMACYAGVSLFRPISDFDVTRFADNRLELNVYPVYSGGNVSYTVMITNKGVVDSALSLTGYEFNWSDSENIYTLIGESTRLIPAGGSIIFETGQFKYVPGKCNVTFIAYPGPVGSSATTPLGMQVGVWSQNTTNCTVAGEGTVNVSIRSMTFQNGVINSTVDFDGEGISKACPTALISFGTYSTDGTEDKVYNVGGCTEVLNTLSNNWRNDFNLRKEVSFSNPSGADLSSRGAACPTASGNKKGPYLSGEMCEAVAVNVSFDIGKVGNCSHLVVTSSANNKSIAYSNHKNSQVASPSSSCRWAIVEFPVRFNQGETSKTFYVYYNNTTSIAEINDNGLNRLHYTSDEIEQFYIKLPIVFSNWNDITKSYDISYADSSSPVQNISMSECGLLSAKCHLAGFECGPGTALDEASNKCVFCGGKLQPGCLSMSSGMTIGTKSQMLSKCVTDEKCNPCIVNAATATDRVLNYVYRWRIGGDYGSNVPDGDVCIPCGGTGGDQVEPACMDSSITALLGQTIGKCIAGYDYLSDTDECCKAGACV